MIDTSATDSVITTIIGTTSTSLTTSFSTTVTVTDSTSTDTSITSDTSTPPPTTVTSSISIPPSTTVVPDTSTPDTSPSVIIATETVTQTPASTPGGSQTPTVVVVTSTFSPDTPTSDTATASLTVTPTTSSPTPSTLSAPGSRSGSSSGLSSGAKIAIAVIIPIVVIAALFLIGFFCWRKRKARKNAEELRKSEMAEYGFNPNSDPTLGVAAAPYTDNQSEGQDDTSGYRGWGATSSNRKASTTLGSNGRAAGGLALSESSSQPGGYAPQASPNATSDQYSADPLMNGHPESGDGVAALGTAGALNRNRSGTGDIRRGPSNASSAYSEGHHSEASSEAPQMPGPYYQEEVPYNIYNEANASHGPYGDGSYGGTGTQPVIRDNQARRNTRIERAPTFPQAQGGIAQNF
ncbi:hypothetical protein AYO21_10482 [Fonsecaea monophora]|uniref:Mid2 domain-containing protein n=2 Tax=Fonsecaea TaxID=40354 RepID=A0A0D2GVN5_9EURO|nr:uncharacterized protein Z517_05702 [Fonsecaea pedrosoi CBS 271.37]XP_022507294.1 hypothetical protein AYO21_10482 [Fonsecaea monophora]KAH0843326.1 hypothetical protein FOPE_08134 [Fonsecaea pedrosoi]KIW82675.1 hypothetical protein Z517_05702 [Fonsecaea pedrosoi CBS 271.37]OAG35342.1 hypothetical protein AYO21_10482 [Fonsecaea monophora]